MLLAEDKTVPGSSYLRLWLRVLAANVLQGTAEKIEAERDVIRKIFELRSEFGGITYFPRSARVRVRLESDRSERRVAVARGISQRAF